MIEQISMDRLGRYCSRKRRQYEVYPDCTTSEGFISTPSWTATLALPVKMSARETLPVACSWEQNRDQCAPGSVRYHSRDAPVGQSHSCGL